MIDLTPNKCRQIDPNWTQEDLKQCGFCRYIVGDIGDNFDSDDNFVIYYNQLSGQYYLDQLNATSSLEELKNQLERLMERIKE